MALTQTLSQLRTEVRQRADQENSDFITDTELTSYINTGYANLYDLLVRAFSDQYMATPETFTLSGTNIRALPSDFYLLRGLDYDLGGGEYVALAKYNFLERNRYRRSVARTLRGHPTRQYRVLGSNIYIEPESQANGDYRLWYVPNITLLSSDSDTVDGVNGWEEYIILDAAIRCMIKEESDPTGLMMLKSEIETRISDIASERDIGEPETISDSRHVYDEYPDQYWRH